MAEYQAAVRAQPALARAPAVAATGGFRWTADEGSLNKTDWFAWAMAAALVGGTSLLLGHGFSKSLPMAAQLEMQLSGLVHRRSVRRSKGGAGKGFFQEWSGFLSGQKPSPGVTR